MILKLGTAVFIHYEWKKKKIQNICKKLFQIENNQNCISCLTFCSSVYFMLTGNL